MPACQKLDDRREHESDQQRQRYRNEDVLGVAQHGDREHHSNKDAEWARDLNGAIHGDCGPQESYLTRRGSGWTFGRKSDAGIPVLESAGQRRRQPELDLLQTLDLIAQTRRILELEVARALEHLPFELLDLPNDGFRAQIRGRAAEPSPLRFPFLARRIRTPSARAPSMTSMTAFWMPRGVIPCCVLNSSCSRDGAASHRALGVWNR